MPSFLSPLRWLSGWLALSVLAFAQGVPSAAPVAPAPVSAAVWRDSAWFPAVTVRSSVGWRDNLLLSPFVPMQRTFGRGELEAIWLRPLPGHVEFIAFLNGEVLRYFSPPPETGGEQQWVLHTEVRWQPWPALRLALKALGYQRDTVIDLSETEAYRVVAPTRVRGGHLTLAPLVTLVRSLRIEPIGQLKRSDYRDYAGDYRERRAGVRAEWHPWSPVELSVAGYELRRDYRQRNAYTAGGRSLPGTSLQFRQRETEVKARFNVRTRTADEWSFAVGAGRMENRDGASGYFDYDQERLRLEVGWRHARWRVALEGETRRLEYGIQTVGSGLTPPPRINDDHEGSLRVERALNDRWSVFGESRWERSRSNEVEFSYRASSVLVGIQRTF